MAFIKYLIAQLTCILMIHVSFVKDTDTPKEQFKGQEHIQQNEYFISLYVTVMYMSIIKI